MQGLDELGKPLQFGLWLQGNLHYPAKAGCVPEVIAQLGAGLRTVAVASAAHLPGPS
jgi:hypothetical protein